MAKTSYQLIPPEFDLLYKKALQSGDRFQIPIVKRKRLFISRRRKKGLSQKSLIPSLSLVWKSFDQSVRDSWDLAGDVCNLTGWRLFLKDTALRLQNDLTGYASPDLSFQALVGRFHIESPASSLKVAQLHPKNYWVQRKVRGTRSQYEPVLITESFDIPLTIKISYKTDLVSVGAEPRARFYAIISSHYQGRIIEKNVDINFNLQSGWVSSSATISEVVGLVRGYSAFIELSDVSGDLWIDNVELEHSGHNWARDPFCNDVNQSFTKAFFQIPKHWAPVDVGEGVYFESEYHGL